MAQTREFTTEEIQGLLRREMPVLDVPEKLSAENVAAVLREKKTRRKTPIYIWARNAVAAAVVLAVGFGAVRAAGLLGGKKGAAHDAEFFPEESSGSYYYSDDSGTDSYIPGEEQTDGMSENDVKEAANEAVKMTVMSPGEETVIDTEVPFDGTYFKSYAAYGEEAADPGEVCAVSLRKGESGQAEIELKAVSAGTLTVELIRDGRIQYQLDITVAE